MVRVVDVVSYVQGGYLSSFRITRGIEVLFVIHSEMALNLFALVRLQHICIYTEGF